MRRLRAALPLALGFGLVVLASSRVRETALGFVNNYTSRYTQTFATASRTHSADGSTAVAAADAAAAAAATATSIAAAIPAAAPAGGVGTAAGGWDTAANRDLAITTINDLRTWSVEVDLDYEALLVDVASIRTQYAAAVTLANELKADFNLLRTAVDNVKQVVNGLIDDLQAFKIIG